NPGNPNNPDNPNNPGDGNSGGGQVSNATRIATDVQGATAGSIQANNAVATRVAIDTTGPLRDNIGQALQRGNLEQAVLLIEQLRQQEFTNYFEGNISQLPSSGVSLEKIGEILGLIAERTGKKVAVVYVLANAEQLDLVLVTPNCKPSDRSAPTGRREDLRLHCKPIYVSVPEAKREVLLQLAREFRQTITDPNERDTDSYKESAQQLYQWLIAPLAAELQARGIDAIAFSMDAGLRTLPIAALYDGQQFLVEKYSISLIPSINLTDTRLGDIKSAQVLAMGASEFKQLNPLPAVPVELSTITNEWSGKKFLNEQFTLANLKSQRAATPFGIIHLATHGEFKPGNANNSFIQFWDTQLKLDQLRQLRWNNPPVELLVLSACRTAVGDEQAELGFGGLAVASGAKTALASLWYVSDAATLALMSEFYPQLKRVAIKADALRQAQIAMLRGQVRLQGGQLQVPGLSSVSLPPELAELGDKTLEHPFYWAGFTMIGSPW
ncbi:MAG TPA: hypothetical protein DDW76_22260, partial [Cyanobacteria bacterium UBA11369]|nr:hypothetical protein [Cyanobacteria bacterium UBA11369]